MAHTHVHTCDTHTHTCNAETDDPCMDGEMTVFSGQGSTDGEFIIYSGHDQCSLPDKDQAKLPTKSARGENP